VEARCFLGRHLSDNVGRGGNLGQAKRCPRISARMKLFRFSWKWRKRSAVKITERTHEEAMEALHAGRKGHHPEAVFAGQGADLKAVRWGTLTGGWVPHASHIAVWASLRMPGKRSRSNANFLVSSVSLPVGPYSKSTPIADKVLWQVVFTFRRISSWD